MFLEELVSMPAMNTFLMSVSTGQTQTFMFFQFTMIIIPKPMKFGFSDLYTILAIQRTEKLPPLKALSRGYKMSK